MILTIIFIVLFIIYLCRTRDKRIAKCIEQFPGPPTYPIVGNIFNYFSTDFQGKQNRKNEKKSQNNVVKLAEMKRREMEAFKKYGDTFRLKVPHGYILSTVDAKISEAILSNTKHYLDKANDYKIFQLVAGNGLVTSRGDYWRSHRKAIQPAFSVSMLKQFIGVFDEKAQILVEILKSQCDEHKVMNIHEFIGRFSGDILLETSMGLKTKIQTDMDSQYVHTNLA